MEISTPPPPPLIFNPLSLYMLQPIFKKLILHYALRGEWGTKSRFCRPELYMQISKTKALPMQSLYSRVWCDLLVNCVAYNNPDSKLRLDRPMGANNRVAGLLLCRLYFAHFFKHSVFNIILWYSCILNSNGLRYSSLTLVLAIREGSCESPPKKFSSFLTLHIVQHTPKASGICEKKISKIFFEKYMSKK